MRKRFRRRSAVVLTAYLLLSFVFAISGVPEVLAQPAPGAASPFSETTTTPITPPKVVQPPTAGGTGVNVPAVVAPTTLSAAESGAESSAESLQAQAQKKKEMAWAEKLAWTIGRALLPTLGVMGFAALAAFPLAWVVVGAVVVGATTSAIVTFLYEQRMNQFRSEAEKKGMDRIMRDVSISAAIDGAMAPFSMLTAGFIRSVGPATINGILTTAGKVAVTQYVGQTISHGVKAGVTNLWYNHYYNYGAEEDVLKSRIKELEKRKNLTTTEQEELAASLKRLDLILQDKYTTDNFVKDQKRAAVSAVIGGFLGGATARMAGATDWAKIASSKMFGTTSKSTMVANAVVSNPFAFVTGSANARLQQRELDHEIEKLTARQKEYAKGSPPWEFYQTQIESMRQTRDAIDIVSAGKDALIGNLAVQGAMMTVSLAETRAWQLPSQRRTAIRGEYQKDDPLWQEADKLKAELDNIDVYHPHRSRFPSDAEYQAAVEQHLTNVEALKTRFNAAKVLAINAQGLPENARRIEEITSKIDAEIDLTRRLELAKALGEEKYLEFKMDQLRRASAGDVDEWVLRDQAMAEMKKEWQASAVTSAQKVEAMNQKLGLLQDPETHSTEVTTAVDGKHWYSVKDANGVEVYKVELKHPTAGFWTKLFGGTPRDPLDAAHIADAAKQAANTGAMIRPSAYRSAFIDMKVAEMRAQGHHAGDIAQAMSAIVSEANGTMLNTYGNDWSTLVKAEMLAAGLERAKYSDGATPGIQDMVKSINDTVRQRAIAQFQSDLRDQIKERIKLLEKEGIPSLAVVKELVEQKMEVQKLGQKPPAEETLAE